VLVTFINQIMQSIITVIDVKILLYKSLKDRASPDLHYISDPRLAFH